MTGAPTSEVAALVAEETQAEEERRTSFLELFFDLVFVFAITQVAALILEDTSVAGFLRSALVLGLASFLLAFALMRFRVVHRIAWSGSEALGRRSPWPSRSTRPTRS